jgi:hypothetical protein
MKGKILQQITNENEECMVKIYDPHGNNPLKIKIYLYLGYIIEGNYCLPFRHFCKGLSPQPITAAPYTGQIEAVDHCPGCIAPTYVSPP